MPTHRGFSAWIEVEGRTLPEHFVAIDDSANRASCWIPSEEGKAFTVHWRDNGGVIATCGFITLDGYVIPGRFLQGRGTTSRGSMRTGQSSARPFIFQRVQYSGKQFWFPASEQTPSLALTSGTDGSAAMDKDVGTIVLRIKRVSLSGMAYSMAIQQPPEIGSSWQGVRIGFGEDQLSYQQFPMTWTIQPYDNPGQSVPSTYVSFAFYYRTPEFLRAYGIISNHQVSDLRHENFMPPVTQSPNVHPQPYITSVPTLPDTVDSDSNPLPVEPSLDNIYINLNSSAQEGNKNRKPVNYAGEGVILFKNQD